MESEAGSRTNGSMPNAGGHPTSPPGSGSPDFKTRTVPTKLLQIGLWAKLYSRQIWKGITLQESPMGSWAMPGKSAETVQLLLATDGFDAGTRESSLHSVLPISRMVVIVMRPGDGLVVYTISWFSSEGGVVKINKTESGSGSRN